MLKSITHHSLLDRLAIGLSGLCAVHCVVTALFVGALSTAGHIAESPLVHETGLALAILVGSVALYAGAMRHGMLLPTAIGSMGLGVMAGALNMPHGQSEAVYTIIGVSIVALSHFLNQRSCRHVDAATV